MLTRRTFLSATLLVGARGAVAQAPAEPSFEIKSDSPLARDIASTEQRYQPFVKYLAKEMGTSFRLLATPGAGVMERPVNSVLVASPVLIVKGMEYGYTPLAQTATKDKLVFITKTSARINRLPQFRGKRLGLPVQGSQAEFMARKTLARVGIVAPEQFFGSILYGSGHENMLQATHAAVVDIACLSERALPPGEPDIAKVLTTAAFPIFGLSVRNGVGSLAFERARKALFLPSDDGRKAMEWAGLAPLDPMDKTFFSATV